MGGGGDQELGNMADVAIFETEQIVVINDVMVCERGQFEGDTIGFDHLCWAWLSTQSSGLDSYVKTPWPIGLGVLTSETSPSGCVDSQVQATMIKA